MQEESETFAILLDVLYELGLKARKLQKLWVSSSRIDGAKESSNLGLSSWWWNWFNPVIVKNLIIYVNHVLLGFYFSEHYYYYYYYYCCCCWAIKNRINKFFFFSHGVRMLNLSLNELKQIPKMRRIKNYKNMSKERLLSALIESERNSFERSVNNFNNARIKKIRKDFNKLRDRF